MDTGLQADADEVEGGAGEGAIDDSTEFGAETEPQEADPLEELRTQVGAAARRDELESLRNQVRSELGRSQRLEARLDALAGVNPLADVDPRLDANENLLNTLAAALVNSDLTDDRDKAALRASLSALDSAKGARAQGKMRAELKAEILGALPSTETTQTNDPWALATQDVLAEIAEVHPTFDVASIPGAVWQEGRAKGTPTRAAAHVLRWVAQQGDEPAASRPAARRQAAGPGSPARQGAAAPTINTMDDADAAYSADRITHDEYRAIRERLLLGAVPGGGR